MESNQKKKLIILIDWYLPGYKAGGPIQSLVNFSMACKDIFDISIITKNHDLHETEPYPNIISDAWTTSVDGMRIFYASPSFLNKKNILQLLESEHFDYLYVNSMYSVYLSLVPIMHLARRKEYKDRIVVAARGSLHPHSTTIKPLKKQLFFGLIKTLGYHKRVIWQGTDETEAFYTKKILGQGVFTKIAANFPRQSQPPFHPTSKQVGELRCVFISRIHTIKNVKFFLERLHKITGKLIFDIFGPKEMVAYWEECEKEIASLPANIIVNYHGGLPHAKVSSTMQQYHFGVLPTTGENFGHAIFDGFVSGLPMLISDRTPWRDLKNKGIGWDLPLEKPEMWEAVIQECMDLDETSYYNLAKNTWDFAHEYRKNPETIAQIKQLFP